MVFLRVAVLDRFYCILFVQEHTVMEEFAALGMVPVSTSRQEILKTTQGWTASRHSRYSIADFIGLPYFSGFPSGLKSHVLLSHDFLSQPKFVPLPRDRAAMCSRPASKHQKKFCFVSKQACIYCIRSGD